MHTRSEPAPALLGRQRERQALDVLLGDLRSGRGWALVVRGEAGIGKSDLLECHSLNRRVPRAQPVLPSMARNRVWALASAGTVTCGARAPALRKASSCGSMICWHASINSGSSA